MCSTKIPPTDLDDKIDSNKILAMTEIKHALFKASLLRVYIRRGYKAISFAK